VDAPAGTGLKIEAKALYSDHATKWYTLALWSKDGKAFPRESVKGQKDADGNVQTDTLVLEQPASRLQLRVSLLSSVADLSPTLKFLGVSLLDDHVQPPALEPNRRSGEKRSLCREGRSWAWPGGSGWCSPTSTNMALAFWAKRLDRPELDLSVPDTAHANPTTASTTEPATGPSIPPLPDRFPESAPMSPGSPTFENWKTGWKSVSPRSSPSPMIC